MALISDEDISKVIEASDFVSIAAEAIPEIKQKGGKFVACCPFHKEKTPSFQIDPNLQLWHCFGCGEGGNVVTFVEKIYDMNFPEAMEFLADKANITLKKTAAKNNISRSQKSKLIEACNLAAEFYHNQLTRVKSADANAARKYLGSRNMGSEIAKKWTLGYAPGNGQLTRYLLSKKFTTKDLIDANLSIAGSDGKAKDRFFKRVMFPIKDTQGNVIAFGGRIMDNSQPKYLNSSENAIFHKSQVLFGLDKAKKNMTSSGMAIVVEGYTDVIALHECGINYAVATLGTALTKQHIRILNQHAKKKIVYLFDGDEAGQRAADRALNFIDQMERPEVYNKRAELVALTLPENLDPKEFIDKYGKDKLIDLINDAKPLLQYGIERKIKEYDLSKPGNKSRAASSALKVLSPIKDSLIAKEYASMISSLTGMRVEDLISELAKLKKPSNYEETDDCKTNETEELSYSTSYKDTKISILENELLCVFAKHPDCIRKIIEDKFDYIWKEDTHKEVFDLILVALNENPSINAQELIMKVHQKNTKAANILTKISNMYDIKNNPVQHGKYIINLLKIEQINIKVSELKKKFDIMDENKDKDLLYKEIINLQMELNSYRKKTKEMI